MDSFVECLYNDTLNRLMKFREVTPTSSHSTLYTYDNDNRVTQLKYNGSQTIGYTRDTLGRVTARTATNTDVNKTTYEYVAGGYGDGSTTNLVSAVNHMSGADALRLRFAYTYDNRGNITSESRKGVMTYYEYDALGQLVWEKSNHDNRAWKYEYDYGGNILKKTKYKFENNAVGDVVQTIAYGYDSAWKDKLVSYNGQTLTYDAIGNLTHDGVWTYTWQHGRQLAAMENSAQRIEFKYDHNGMRVEKKVTAKGDNSVETTQYYYHGKKLMRQVKGNHVLHFYYDAEGRPAMVMYNGTMYTYAHSLQGDIAAIVDSAGNLVVEYKYDAWGNITTSFGTLKDTLGKLNPFCYRGYVYDVETTFYWLRDRYYTARYMRFINADIVFRKELFAINQWVYSKNSPLVFGDSNGTSEYYVVLNFYMQDHEKYTKNGHIDFSIVPVDLEERKIRFFGNEFVDGVTVIYGPDNEDRGVVKLQSYSELTPGCEQYCVMKIDDEEFAAFFSWMGNNFVTAREGKTEAYVKENNPFATYSIPDKKYCGSATAVLINRLMKICGIRRNPFGAWFNNLYEHPDPVTIDLLQEVRKDGILPFLNRR